MKTHHKKVITYKTVQTNFQGHHSGLNSNPSFQATYTDFDLLKLEARKVVDVLFFQISFPHNIQILTITIATKYLLLFTYDKLYFLVGTNT